MKNDTSNATEHQGLINRLEAISNEGAMIHCLSWVAIQEALRAAAMALSVRSETAPAALHVEVAEMGESNGRVTWIVYLRRSVDEAPWDSYQLYDSQIKGRAEYEAARLKHFLGQAPEPDMSDFDVDAPPSVTPSATRPTTMAESIAAQIEGGGHGRKD